MDVVALGIVIVSILDKPLKAFCGTVVSRVMTMFFKEAGTEPNIVAKLLVELTLLPTNGTVILTIELQPLKALLPMDVTASRITTSLNNPIFWKAPSPIEVHDVGVINLPF